MDRGGNKNRIRREKTAQSTLVAQNTGIVTPLVERVYVNFQIKLDRISDWRISNGRISDFPIGVLQARKQQ